MNSFSLRMLLDLVRSADIIALNSIDWPHFTGMKNMKEGGWDNSFYYKSGLSQDELTEINSFMHAHSDELLFKMKSVSAMYSSYGYVSLKKGWYDFQKKVLKLDDIHTLEQWNRIDWSKYIYSNTVLSPVGSTYLLPTVIKGTSAERISQLSRQVASLVEFNVSTDGKAYIDPTQAYVDKLAAALKDPAVYTATFTPPAPPHKAFKNAFYIIPLDFDGELENEGYEYRSHSTLEEAKYALDKAFESEANERCCDVNEFELAIVQIVSVASVEKPENVKYPIKLDFSPNFSAALTPANDDRKHVEGNSSLSTIAA